mmetsp:Transcript_71291/g.167007  ORF Transcript_71291/g.167007 Transcript_71291/m.167007 type:complete len:323 (-) Transcript_71291:166-1134(-)
MESLELIDFEEWIQERQIIVSLAMFITTPVVVPILAYGEACLNSLSTHGLHASSSYRREVFETIAVLWEGAYIFLFQYGCLKHSVTFAAILVLVYSLIRSSFHVVVGIRCAKKDMEKQVDNDELQPVSVYTDMEAGTFLKCVAVFVLQMLLYVMLFRWINSQPVIDPETTEEVVTWYFIAGAIVSTVSRTMSAGFVSGELLPFWAVYFYAHGGKYHRSHHYPKMRFFMSWLVNSYLNHAIFLMLPLVVMISDNDMEFVKDATAVLFISQLDSFENDLSGAHTLRPAKDTASEAQHVETQEQSQQPAQEAVKEHVEERGSKSL